jgi:hypothetical protein
MEALNFLKKNKWPLLFLLSTWGSYFLILWSKMLYFNSNGDLTAGWRIIWADWSMHIGQINAFYYQPFSDVLKNHPLFFGIPLSYPFLSNYFSALMLKLGFGLIQATIWPSMVFSLMLLLALFYLGKKLVKSNIQVVLAIFMFLASGGLGFYYFLKDLLIDFSWNKFIFPPQEYTRIDDLGIKWYNTIVANLVPQRAFLLGLILGSLILGLLFSYYKNSFKKVSFKKIIWLGVITGLLAWIHTHTLLLIFLVCLWLFIFDIKNYKHWFLFALGVLTTSASFFILLGNHNFWDFVKIKPGWLIGNQGVDLSFWQFWLLNWGLVLPLFPIGLYLAKLKKKVNLFFLSFGFVFLLCNLLIFQPFDWDNSKLLLYVYLFFCFPIAGLLIKIWQKSYFGKIAASLLFLVLTFSGTLDLIRILNTSQQSFVMLTKEEIELANFLRQNSETGDLVLTSDHHLHWAPIMSGRNIVMGYRGWLWSHGINYKQRQSDVYQIYNANLNPKELIEKYGIDFVVTDDKTRLDFNSNEEFFRSNYQLLISQGQYRIYRIN